MREHVGSYEVVRVLARGGMAVVYLARQPTLDRNVALKRLHLESSDPTLAERFVREARLAAGLDHAEVRGIVHRDLKPENVLISRNGGVKIADFGIARAYNALTPSLTGTGATVGTPTYMAPEQVTGEPLGPYTDVYALGVMAYELLAGQPPFDPQVAPLAVLYCHVHQPPPPLATLAPDAPPPLCTWIEWLLAKAPADRPASAVAARQALEEIAVDELGPYWRRAAAINPEAAPVPTLEVTAEEPPTRRATPTSAVRTGTRRRRAAGAATAVVIAGAATAAALLLPADESRAPPPSPSATPTRTVANAVPYDFSGDGRPDLVLGMPASGRSREGTVVTLSPRGRRVITLADVGVAGPYDGDEEFGRGTAGGDFDRDGHADLAISVPGRNRIAVISGTASGLVGGRVKRIRGTQFRPGAGRYGNRIVAADVNRDGFDDLVVGAPTADAGPAGSGIIQIVYGGRNGLATRSTSQIPRPVESITNFGAAVRVGDLNADGNVDVIEGNQDNPDTGGGHLGYCLGARGGGFDDCQILTGPVSSGSSALAVADVNGDHYDDIVQGDHIVEPTAVGSAAGGEVRLWLGRKRGARGTPLVIDQDTDWMPGDDEAGDAFGMSVGAADLDRDGYADIAVGATGENGGDGAVTIIRGGRAGFAREAHTSFSVGDGFPGERGAGAGIGMLSVVDVRGDRRPDIVVKAGGAHDLRDAVYVLVPRKGAIAPGEVKIWKPFRRGIDVPNAQIRDIRLARRGGA